MFNSKINTMKRTLMLMIALLVVSVGIATAQTLTVRGTVVAEKDGQPVAGAYVLVNGTTIGTITNEKGEFGIREVPADAKEIIVTFLGMTTASAPVQAEPLKIVMHEDATYLDETTVVAFGTKRKQDLVGSVVKVDKTLISNTQATSVSKALEGAVAGLQVISASGQPGDDANIVVDLTVENVGDDAVANAHLQVRTDGAARKHCGVLGLDRPDLHFGIVRL